MYKVSFMKKSLACLALLAMLFSRCTTTQNLGGEELPSESLIWQISGGELAGNSYIVGTLPIQDSLFYNYPDKVWNYLEKSDVFISFDTSTEQQTQSVRNTAFSDLGKHYQILPAAYFEQIATQQMMPVISLNDDLSLQQNSPGTATKPIAPKSLTEAFLLGNTNDLVEARIGHDLTTEQLDQLQNKTNYLILDDLVRHMKLQPIFFPADVAYLSGTNGLVNLLRARGYQVKQLQTRFYANNAKEIMARRAMLAQQQYPQNQQQSSVETTIPPAGDSFGRYNIPDNPQPLNLPIGLMNIDSWSNYELTDSSLFYSAPNRLKSSSDGQNLHSTIHDNLEYIIERKQPGNDFDSAIQQLIISNGGQLVSTNKLAVSGYPARYIELIYGENQLSKHLLIPTQSDLWIVSVKGPSPQIFSLQANQFIESVKLAQQAPTVYSVNNPENNGIEGNVNSPEQNLPVWQASRLKEMSVYFPVQPTPLSHDLENNNTLQGYVIPRGKIDNNMYLLTAAEQSSFDNFKLFNDAINETAKQARAVIIERNVMPQGRSNFSSYLLRDAVDNYYKISYWYQNNVFYQLIIRGDERSVNNNAANQLQQSVQFGNQPVFNGTN